MLFLTANIQACREVVALLSKHRRLTWEMAKNEISDRYAGQVLGAFWTVVHPLFLMALYVFIFAFVFRITFNNPEALPRDYATYILAGLVPWISLQDSMNKSTTAILSNVSLVKQVVFPIEILPAKGVIVTLITQLISLAFLSIYLLVRYWTLPWTFVLLPLVILGSAMIMVGMGFVLSAAGAYFRDIKDIVQIAGLVGMYLAPVFYLPENVPKAFAPALYANPFSYVIWCYQDAIYFGSIRHPWAWLVFGLLSFFVFAIGYRAFRKAKLFIGNVV
jgi:lipopolysaccharide transport system permease protein